MEGHETHSECARIRFFSTDHFKSRVLSQTFRQSPHLDRSGIEWAPRNVIVNERYFYHNCNDKSFINFPKHRLQRRRMKIKIQRNEIVNVQRMLGTYSFVGRRKFTNASLVSSGMQKLSLPQCRHRRKKNPSA